MAYLGRQAGQLGNYIRCNTITPDGSTTTFALTNVLDSTAVAPGSENNVLCSISGVMQAPGSGNAFTINNTNIVFSEAPDAADTVDFILVLGQTIDIGTPSDGTVAAAQLHSTLNLASKTVTLPNTSVTNDTIQMTIDGSGRVTMPNQIGFQADGNFGWRDYSSFTVVPSWRTTQTGQFNIGSHFNHNTGWQYIAKKCY